MKHYLGVAGYGGFFGLLLFVPAGTLHWPRAWVLLGVLLVVRLAGTWRMLRGSSDLLEERSGIPLRRDQPLADKLLLPGFMLSFALLIAFDGWDAVRLRLLGGPRGVASAAGLVLFAAGWGVIHAALQSNAFATTAVRHQPERGHHVVSEGIYRVVRHPMYAGVLGVMLGMGWWLGTWAGMLAMVVPTAILVVRILVEESVLVRTLPEYPAYRARVRSRLIPGVW